MTALTVPSHLISKQRPEEEFNQIASTSYFPFISVVQKPREDGITLGNFILSKGIGGRNVLDLSSEFNCLVHGMRPCVRYIDQTTGKVSSWFDLKANADKFRQAELEQAKKGMTGWMYGPEFLLYLPEYQEFATFLFGNVTLRNEAPNMKTLIGRAATLKTGLIKTQYTWYGVTCIPCQVELPKPENYEAWEQLAVANVNKFDNPPAITEQVPEEAAVGGSERAR